MSQTHIQTRDHILIYLNGERRELRGAQAFMTLSDYLRHERQLTGTKVVCAEGDCGACSVLVGAVKPSSKITAVQYQVINACIQFMHGLDCSQIITIEGIQADRKSLHPVQAAMVKAQATQCGFCTPGFVMAAAGMLEHKGAGSEISQQQAKNYLTGNLCRCTGYQSIIEAMTTIDTRHYDSIKDRYHPVAVHDDLLQHSHLAVSLSHQENYFESPTTATTAAASLAVNKGKIFAAATDLGVQYNKGHWQQQQAISLNLVPELHSIKIGADSVKIGARACLSELEKALQDIQPEWSGFMHIFASPQIKNNGTLVGNVANGSPIGDNLPFLLALDATLTLQSPTQTRLININDFYLGYKQLNLHDDEVITYIDLPNKPADSVLKLYKVSQRRDLDISCVSAAIMMQFDHQNVLKNVAIALGGVAATARRIDTIEHLLLGQSLTAVLDPDQSQKTAQQLAATVTPMSDVRGSDHYRIQLIQNLYLKFINELRTTKTATRDVNHAV